MSRKIQSRPCVEDYPNQVYLYARSRKGEELHVRVFEPNRKYVIEYFRKVKYMPIADMEALAQKILHRLRKPIQPSP